MLWKTHILVGIYVCLQIVSTSRQEEYSRSYNVDPGRTYYTYSPNYPEMYTGPSFRNKYVAPLDHETSIQCTIDMPEDNQCRAEGFYVSREGDLNLTGAEVFCGYGSINRASIFRSIVIAYITTVKAGFQNGSRFLCEVTAQPIVQNCECGWSQTSRIVGGETVHHGEFPSIVGIGKRAEKQILCAGTIIDHRFVVTTGHCVEGIDPRNLFIAAGLTYADRGSKYTKLYAIEEIYLHPKYRGNNNNIALVKTTRDIEWSREIGPACLPFGLQNDTFVGAEVMLLGWGLIKVHDARPAGLQKVQVKVTSNAECESTYPDLTESEICTYAQERGSCQFDDGGPVLYSSSRQYLLAVINDGYSCGEYPGRNTRIALYLDWITSVSGNKLCHTKFN